MDQECSSECQAVMDAAVGMPVDEVTTEVEASGRFQDPSTVAQFLASGGEPPMGDEEIPTEEPEEPPLDE